MRAMPLLFAVSVPSPVFAATLTVGPSHAEYRTIGDALADAADGDVIAIHPGIYRERVVVERDVVLRGTGNESTLVPNESGPAILVTAGADARIEQLALEPHDQGIAVDGGSRLLLSLVTIRGADADGPGAALSVRDGSDVRLETVRLLDNASAAEGGHVYVEGSRLSIAGSSFVNGRARAGGALAAHDADVHVVGSRFEGNAAVAGGAIGAVASDVTLERAVLEGNRADGPGGAIDVEDGALDLRAVDLRANTAADGAAVAIRGQDASLGAVDATFADHQASGTGGAVAFLAGSGELALGRVTFRGNEAARGGAVGVAGTDAALWIERSTFDGNAATAAGGALWVDGAADLRLVDNDFTANASERRGGAVDLAEVAEARAIANRFCGNASAWQGGAVHDRYTGHHLWFANRFTGNAAGTAGGAVAVTFPRFDAVDGALHGAGPAFVNNAFLRNEATSAGAVWLTAWDGYSGTYLDFRNNLLAWNEGHGAVLAEPLGMDTVVAWNALWRTGDLVGLDAFATMTADPRLSDDGCATSHLQADSPLVDAGDPALADGDGTRSDVGADGGPYAVPTYAVAWTDDGVVVEVDDRPDAHPPGADEPATGCTTAPAHAAWTFLLLPLLARRRRR